jgi:hypothetical protein
MPPRKSTRQDGTTPVRQIRESTADTGATPPGRRSGRKAAQKAASSIASTRTRRTGLGRASLGEGDHLPDVQTQTSYAYGAKEGPVMPDTLATVSKYSIAEMANHIEEAIDVDTDEASDQQLQQDDEEDQMEDQITVQDPRRQDDPQDSSQLTDIPEEDSESEVPEPSSPPSAFPSDMPDQSYAYERGVRGVRRLPPRRLSPDQLHNTPRRQPPPPTRPYPIVNTESVSPFTTAAKTKVHQVGSQLDDAFRSLCRRLVQVANATAQSIRKMPLSALRNSLLVVLGTLVFLVMLASSVCFAYGRLGCDLAPTTSLGQSIHSGFQIICGSCQTFNGPIDLSNITPGDFAKMSAALDGINKKVGDLERRLSYRIDNKYSSLDSELTSLRQQQAALTNHLADHVDSQSSPSSGYVASPLIPKVNFFAPSNGAVINVVKTSPTKDRVDSLPLRVLRRCLRVVQQRANPPVTALVAWQDAGDCWCAANAASGDFVRLAVSTKEMLYPVELVVEHLPASGNLDRGSMPKQMELWADFSHLNEAEWEALQLNHKQEGNVLGPMFARIGFMKYDASGSSSHVQSFQLEVNRHDMMYSSKNFVLRVTSNYGGENVCLYRVRLHGQPVAAPNAGMVDHWYEQQGYQESE